MSSFKWLWENLKGYRKRYLLCFFLSMVIPMSFLINPTFQRRLVDKVLVGEIVANGSVSEADGRTAALGENGAVVASSEEGAQITRDADGSVRVRWLNLLVPTVAAMCLVTLARSLLQYASVALVESASLGLVFNLRMKIFNHLQSQDMKFYSENTTGDIMTILTGDLDMVRHNLVFVFRQIVSSLLLFIGASVYYFVMNWKFALAMIALTPFIFVVTFVYRSKVHNIYKELRRRLSRLNTDAQENIEGNRVVKAFANERHEIGKFNDKSQSFREQNLHAQYIWLRFFPWIEGLAQSMTVTTLLFGGIFIIGGEITAGEFIAFNALSWAVTEPFRQLGQLFNDIQRFFASATKIMQALETAPEVKNTGTHTGDGAFRGEVELRGVRFDFGGATVLEDVSFRVQPGQTFAVMGETGSGKTLIAELISRFYDPASGDVLVDGVNLRDWDLTALRKNIGMTTQEVFLFSDTVDSNIAYGDLDLPEEDVRRFAEDAAADFIGEMPEGFATIVGERGVGLSGGQKQRIALARALAIRPGILILDDTTSAVDMETEKFIQERLAALDFPCTKLIIAQRISSVRNADCILLLENGRIVERGSHMELLRQRGRYYELWHIQAGLDEETEVAILAGGLEATV